MLPAPLNIEFDEGSGDVLLFLHGFLGSPKDWRPTVERFESRYRCVGITLPGHGDAPVAPFNWANQFWRIMDDLERHIRQLGAAEVHLVGYSMGSRLALNLAIHRPHLLNSLTLEGVSPGIETESERLARQEKEYDWIIKLTTGKQNFLERWSELPMFANQRKRNKVAFEQIRQRRANGDVDGWINALRHFGLSRQPNFWTRLENLDVPTLLMTGIEDEKFTLIAERMTALLPNSRHSTIKNSGHAPHIEQPVEFAQTVSDFLDSL